MIDPTLRAPLEPELHAGETLLWAGRPEKRPYPWRGVCRAVFWFFWIMFVLLFTLFSIASFSSDEGYVAIKVLFVCLGCLMFYLGYVMRKSLLKGFLGPQYEVYGLTEQRVIILSPLWKDTEFFNSRGIDHSKQFIEKDDLDRVKIYMSADKNMGTILFSGWWDKIRYRSYTNIHPDIPKKLHNLNGFRNIKDADKVLHLLQKTFGTLCENRTQAPLMVTHDKVAKQVENKDSVNRIKAQRFILWMIFPVLWFGFTVWWVIAARYGLFVVSFLGLSPLLACVIFAVREVIRPNHTYTVE